MVSVFKSALAAEEGCQKAPSATEHAGSCLLGELRAAIGRGRFSQVVTAQIDSPLRRTWRDLFDPYTKERLSDNYESLRTAFRDLGNLRLGELKNGSRERVGWDMRLPTFEEFANERAIKSNGRLKYFLFPESIGGYLDFMATLMNRSEGYFVVSVMSSGFSFGAETAAILRENGKLANFVFAGYTGGRYPHENHNYRFRDGSNMVGKVFIAPEDLELIDQNTAPVLVVDDSIVTGGTTSEVEALLRKHGADEVYKISGDLPALYL